MTVTDESRTLHDFEEALHESSDELAHLRMPAHALGQQLSNSAELMDWLYRGGWTRWGWPETIGGFGGPATIRCQIYEKLALSGYRIPDHLFVLEVVGPAVVSHAPSLAAEMMPKALSGVELWCQGFSEPEAGSDLASLRTRAVARDDGSFSVSGQKIWTSYGARADRIVLLARTGSADSRHRGLSMMLVDLDQDGIERRPIALASGREELSEIFFTDVRVDSSRLIGDIDGGWKVAMDLLQYERGVYAWMRMASTTAHLAQILRQMSDKPDALAADVVGRAYLALAGLRARTASTLRRLSADEVVGAQTSVDKLLLSTAEQKVLDASLTLLDAELLIGDRAVDAGWRDEWWYSRAASVYGGAREIQHSIIADRILGLPKESSRGR
ncbi:acyl-CoA dehydrogenase family protein [Gordonia insulae]|uniref:Acyl-CoA dehydrogenase FadE17 n=1 Tax=Gordonia insulae TaxID=2420509 RepID=A0A3G8JLL7_9ACTN|nr:acyl-CoA dehydrogenase family protein [Gordonia insulae]AZG45485.1 Putative acyl-CoA dehydrogenase FadE17 [Gordonia insulae]